MRLGCPPTYEKENRNLQESESSNYNLQIGFGKRDGTNTLPLGMLRFSFFGRRQIKQVEIKWYKDSKCKFFFSLEGTI